MTTVLDARDIVKTYPGRGSSGVVRALEGLSLHIDEGECVAIIGESGSGKSTFAKLVMGLEQPTSGSISVMGAPPRTTGRSMRTAKTSIVLQDPADSLNPRMSVRAAIGEPLVVQRPRPSRQSVTDAVLEAMAAVGLDKSMIGSRVSRLSGGQMQRVGIARALIRDPDLVILDEPTSALDPSVQAQILVLLSSLQHTRNLSMLLITHDLAVAAHLSTRMCVLRHGKLVEFGPADRIWSYPQHPYTKALVAASVMSTDTPPADDADPLTEGGSDDSGCLFIDVCGSSDAAHAAAAANPSTALFEVSPGHWVAPSCHSVSLPEGALPRV